MDATPDEQRFKTQAEAVEAAIAQIRQEGGGDLTLHQESCTEPETGGDECPCHPMVIRVDGCDG